MIEQSCHLSLFLSLPHKECARKGLFNVYLAFLIPEAALMFCYFSYCQEICTLARDIHVPDLDAVIESLRNEGCLLYKGSGMFQVNTSPYIYVTLELTD